jgi:hypothetical protein
MMQGDEGRSGGRGRVPQNGGDPVGGQNASIPAGELQNN